MRVGVIVPVHGWAPYLAETLDSLLEQARPPDDIVVVDDGSPEPVVLPPAHADRCRVVRRPTRGGLARARQTGFEHLDAELIALCDGDDAWEPAALDMRLQALERVPEAGVCFGRARIVGPDGRPTGERWQDLAPGPHPAESLASVLYARNPIPVSSSLLRREAVIAAGGLDSRFPLAEDWDLWLRLVARGWGFVYEPRAVVRYRRHPHALSADVAGLAAAQRAVHTAHAALVDTTTRTEVAAADLRALGGGLVRERRYREARDALREAFRLSAPAPAERARLLALGVPGVRGILGRRDPYRR